jgi:hypothetical protein
MKRLLARLSAEQLRDLLAAKKRIEKAEPLKRKRAKLLKAAAKLQKKIDYLLSGAAAGRSRPRRQKRTLSAKARRAIALAQKRRWAAYRKARAR